ncbi:glycosyltransferase [Clostridium thermarum]|uniref:glycosyltransferase n=1 Tax=Clostridium thermarum TaxID=1716543 RepID=UPI00111E7C2C|nr:glycosyltransferase [Clostridium thermarum]
MIFVSVGTHEQQFNRLISKIDALVKSNEIKDTVFIQSGYSTEKIECCDFKKLIGYEEMEKYTREASIIIVHGGPGSIMQAWKYGKKPIVVPRNPIFGEHVDNHQIKFTQRLERDNMVLAVYDIEDLEKIIVAVENGEISLDYSSKFNNNINFVAKFIEELNR